jgi:hypothetical protein
MYECKAFTRTSPDIPGQVQIAIHMVLGTYWYNIIYSLIATACVSRGRARLPHPQIPLTILQELTYCVLDCRIDK